MPKYGRNPAKGLGPRSCEVCETEFQPYRVKQTTCSRECYKKSPGRLGQNKRNDARPERRARKNELRRTETGGQQVTSRREYVRRRELAKIGLTPEDYDRMLAAQGGKCILCGAAPDPNGIRAASRLHADHDHLTGRHRDLLCGRCNVGVGMFRDDPALLRAAAEYIERHRREHLP